MGCFCRQSGAALGETLAQLRDMVPSGSGGGRAGAAVAMPASTSGADRVLRMGNWLEQRGLPGAPFVPDPAWLSLDLPEPALSPASLSTLLALLQLRADAQAVLGVDVLAVPQALGRVVATLNLRVGALAALQLDLSPWLRLAALDRACTRLRLAIEAGLFLSDPALPAFELEPQWQSFLPKIEALMPLVLIAQLSTSAVVLPTALLPAVGVGATGVAGLTATLGASVRAMAALRVPALPDVATVLGLMGGLAAVAQLRASLGVDPVQLGLPAVQASLQIRVQDTLALLPPRMTSPRGASGLAMAIDAGVVRATISAPVRALAALRWAVPARDAIPALGAGPAVCALLQQLDRGLGLAPVRLAPCDGGCDAARAVAAAA